MRKEAEAAVISHRERLPDQTSPTLGLSAVREVLSALASLPRLDSCFELVDEDKVAVIFVARPQPNEQ